MVGYRGSTQVLWISALFSILFHGLSFLFLSPAPGGQERSIRSDVVPASGQLAQPKAGKAIQMITLAPDLASTTNVNPPRGLTAKYATPVIAPLLAQENVLISAIAPVVDHDGVSSQRLPGVLVDTPLAVPEYFYRANDLDYRAEMLLPMEMTWFEDQFALSGSLKMSIYVRKDGTVERIDLLNIVDVSGELREKLLPLIYAAKFKPAAKRGEAVNSIKTMEFDLSARDDPKDTTLSTLAGFRPSLDAKGNIEKNQDLSLMPRKAP